jgi:two-component system copper resistance phosphate regulon response regulator CusR
MKVLVVEDDPRIVSFLERGLRAYGYAVEAVPSGEEALARAPEADLVILDLGLPDMDGITVLLRLREDGVQVPVIVLTARYDVDDRVRGLNSGADDYIAKPFAFDELLARVGALLRPRGETTATVLPVGAIRLDLQSHEVVLGDRVVALTAHEFSLIEMLARHPGQVLSREQLLSHVWGYDFDPLSNLVDVYVGYLRKKLGSEKIETVRGAGYRLRG